MRIEFDSRRNTKNKGYCVVFDINKGNNPEGVFGVIRPIQRSASGRITFYGCWVKKSLSDKMDRKEDYAIGTLQSAKEWFKACARFETVQACIDSPIHQVEGENKGKQEGERELLKKEVDQLRDRLDKHENLLSTVYMKLRSMSTDWTNSIDEISREIANAKADSNIYEGDGNERNMGDSGQAG